MAAFPEFVYGRLYDNSAPGASAAPHLSTTTEIKHLVNPGERVDIGVYAFIGTQVVESKVEIGELSKRHD